jgi:2,4-dienoyl-CoA reductase-like NADH-dependent reductase (Old Yellow Enzyme family)
MTSRDPLLQPFHLKRLRLKNRIVSTPHAPSYAEEGLPKERYQRYHEEKAKGGLAMTMFGGSSCVGPDSPSVFGQLYVGDDRIIPYFQAFAERIHRYDCALVCQISHLGRRTTWNSGDWLPVTSASRVREPAHRGFPKEMDLDDIARIVGYYAAAARRCRDGGLDGCEVLSHGHLLEQFLSSATNLRSDGYGGSLENRLRFTLEVLEAVRLAVGDDFIVGIRQGVGEGFEGGLTREEGITAAKAIAESGLVDYMTVNFGHIESNYALSWHMPGMAAPLGVHLAEVATLRREIALPLIHACRIADLATARHAVREDILDLVGMTRAHIADPHIVSKLVRGEEERIRPCVGAGYCIDRIYGEGEALCLHNPATGREGYLPHVIEKSSGPTLKVVVVGGGPGGLEAARVAAERGHRVILFEATSALGGQLQLATKVGWRRDLIGIVDWLTAELERLAVEIRWNCLVGPEEVLEEAPDVVIIATGGLPDSDLVPGGEHCLSVWDALGGADLSGDILVYDDSGQHQGPSCTDYLSDRADARIELVTPDRHAAHEMGAINFPIYLQNFYRKGVRLTPDHRLKGLRREGNKLRARFTNEYGGPEIERLVDHLVVEHGTLPNDELFQELRSKAVNRGVTDIEALVSGKPQALPPEGFRLFAIGDAVASRNVHAAMLDALRLCKDL